MSHRTYFYARDRIMAARKNSVASNTVGFHIKSMREKMFPGHGGQTRCASAFGVSQAEWSRWENGGKLPSASTQKKIADFFRVGMDDLWGGRADDNHAGDATASAAPNNLAKLFHSYIQIQGRLNTTIGRIVSDPTQYESFLAIMESLIEKLDNLDRSE